MTQAKHFTHGLFSLSHKDNSSVVNALPENAKLLSFFPITGSLNIPYSCSASLVTGKPFSQTLSDDAHFISAFLNRMDTFFFKISHAVIYAEYEAPHSMTMFTSGLLCAIKCDIKYLTVQSSCDMSHLLKGGSLEEQAKVNELIRQGNVLISDKLSDYALKDRLKSY